MANRRIILAAEEAKGALVGYEQGHSTIVELACSLQRIRDLLTGEPYYDYHTQEWETGE